MKRTTVDGKGTDGVVFACAVYGMRDQKDGGMLLSVEGIAVDKKSWPTMMVTKLISMVEKKALDEMTEFEDAWVENMKNES